MAAYTGKNGNYKTQGNSFAKGGEGEIFNLVGKSDAVAKIYPLGKRTTERERKLLSMVAIQPGINQYSWPSDVLYENGSFVGYVMPKISGIELRNIYGPNKRKGKPWSLYVNIAKNLTAAIYHVHLMNQVIGDLNPNNILIDQQSAMVTLIDTDSYHITDPAGNVHRCGVGMPEYIAPELQGKHFPSADLPTFEKETDSFSLAVLIFALLMNGAHPFSCRIISGSLSQFSQDDNIKNGVCPYLSGNSKIDIPLYVPSIDCLPKELTELFRRAFVDGQKNAKLRPTAEEYYIALENLGRNIKRGTNPEHYYYSNASKCPWCEVTKKMGGRISVNCDSTVTVPTVSQKPSVPYVFGMSQTDAESAIKSAGLKVGTITNQNHNNVPFGKVFEQSPAGGSSATIGTPVNLQVSSGTTGSAPSQLVVPNVCGMTLADAESRIRSAGFQVGVIDNRNHSLKAGRVFSQSPAHGAAAVSGTYVDLQVSKGRGTVPKWLVASIVLLVFIILLVVLGQKSCITESESSVVAGQVISATEMVLETTDRIWDSAEQYHVAVEQFKAAAAQYLVNQNYTNDKRAVTANELVQTADKRYQATATQYPTDIKKYQNVIKQYKASKRTQSANKQYLEAVGQVEATTGWVQTAEEKYKAAAAEYQVVMKQISGVAK